MPHDWYAAKRNNPYLGEEVRIVRVHQRLEGRPAFAIKSERQTIAISADKKMLITLASDRYMRLVEIED